MDPRVYMQTNDGGFYGVETNVYVHSDHDKVTVIVKTFSTYGTMGHLRKD